MGDGWEGGEREVIVEWSVVGSMVVFIGKKESNKIFHDYKNLKESKKDQL